jgi:hypothetical protein
MVLLQAFDERGFVFFTNYESRKATEIATHPPVSLLFPGMGWRGRWQSWAAPSGSRRPNRSPNSPRGPSAVASGPGCRSRVR